MLLRGPIAGFVKAKLASSLGRLKRDDRGATAVEFAIVIAPFFMFIFCLVGCAFYFFMTNSIEKGLDQAARLVRTGQAVTAKMTVEQFRNTICSGAGSWVDCNKLKVYAAASTGWNDKPTLINCLNDNSNQDKLMVPTDLIAKHTGTASQVVFVTTCYKWNFTKILPFFKIGNAPDGSTMLQAATAFRSEPYTNN